MTDLSKRSLYNTVSRKYLVCVRNTSHDKTSGTQIVSVLFEDEHDLAEESH